MTVHNIRLAVSTVDPDGNAIDADAKKTEVEDWANNHDEVLQTERVSFGSGNTEADQTGTDYYTVIFRFAWSEDPLQLKDEVVTWLTNNFKWWVVSYHECNHDENPESRGTCSWDNEWSDGSPPSKLLNL